MDLLTEMEVRALVEALDDEYRSWAVYDQVIADFGAMRQRCAQGAGGGCGGAGHRRRRRGLP